MTSRLKFRAAACLLIAATDGGAAAAPAGQAEGQGSDRREPASNEAESQPTPSEGAKWDPEKESLPARRRIMGSANHPVGGGF